MKKLNPKHVKIKREKKGMYDEDLDFAFILMRAICNSDNSETAIKDVRATKRALLNDRTNKCK